LIEAFGGWRQRGDTGGAEKGWVRMALEGTSEMILVTARKGQLQRSCVIQSSVDAQRLGWVARAKGTNSEGVVSEGRWRIDATPSELRNLWVTVSQGSPLRGQPWADGRNPAGIPGRGKSPSGAASLSSCDENVFKLRQERNMPPRWGLRISWRGLLQRFRS